LLLCIVEGQWRYHTTKQHDPADTLFEILEGWGLEVVWSGVKE